MLQRNYRPLLDIGSMICPACGSAANLTDRSQVEMGLAEIRTFECKDCGKTTRFAACGSTQVMISD
jgi:RNase P subunit RPR2